MIGKDVITDKVPRNLITKRKKKRTKLSRLRATPVNALRASLRNAFAIIVLCFLLLLLLRFTSRICAASFLIMCRINLSRVRWRRDAFPLEKKEEDLSLSQKQKKHTCLALALRAKKFTF